MKRLVLFVVALVFAFCTTVMAADKPAAVGTAAPAKAADTKKVKKDKKAVKKAKKAEKAPAAPAAPAK
jgi:sugar phosphate permease